MLALFLLGFWQKLRTYVTPSMRQRYTSNWRDNRIALASDGKTCGFCDADHRPPRNGGVLLQSARCLAYVIRRSTGSRSTVRPQHLLLALAVLCAAIGIMAAGGALAAERRVALV